jgi:hypothetical protein
MSAGIGIVHPRTVGQSGRALKIKALHRPSDWHSTCLVVRSHQESTMNLLFARFVMLMVMVALIAVAALGQRDSLASNPGGLEGSLATACPTVVAQVVDHRAGHEPVRRTPRRTIRWQSFLPGTFR